MIHQDRAPAGGLARRETSTTPLPAGYFRNAGRIWWTDTKDGQPHEVCGDFLALVHTQAPQGLLLEFIARGGELEHAGLLFENLYGEPRKVLAWLGKKGLWISTGKESQALLLNLINRIESTRTMRDEHEARDLMLERLWTWRRAGRDV